MNAQPVSFVRRFALWFAFAALLAIVLMPTPEGLPVAGKRMLGILVFSVIVWMTEAVSYPVSAAVIVSLMAFLLGSAPSVADPSKVLGTNGGLGIALGGFSNTAWALVAGALFLAAAMTKTGLDKRIALFVLSKIGARTNRVLIGVILVGFLLSFFVPSTTARVSCLVPIVMGIILAFGVERRSRFAGMMMIATAQADSLWNVGIKTAAVINVGTATVAAFIGVGGLGEPIFNAIQTGFKTQADLQDPAATPKPGTTQAPSEAPTWCTTKEIPRSVAM